MVSLSPVYDDFLEFLIEKATPQEILAFTASNAAQERAEALLEKNNAGTLTADELPWMVAKRVRAVRDAA